MPKEKEAIKYVISLNDDFILLDSKRFIAYLRDLYSEEVKPLKALQNGINDQVLHFFFKDKGEISSRITKINCLKRL